MDDVNVRRFGSPKSIIKFYEHQLKRYLKLGIGECSFEDSIYYGPNHNGVIISENLINATRRRLVQLKNPFIKVSSLSSMGQNGQFRLKKKRFLR